MKVSVITTVLNEEQSIDAFIRSLLTQTTRPDEIVILDGGSSDRTMYLLRGFATKDSLIRVISDPQCNIRYSTSPVAKGRNIAIRSATGDVIAVTDAGCRLDREWLENIVAPFIADPTIDVVGGWYEPWTESAFEEAAVAVTFPHTLDIIRKNFIPSSRSIAFTKAVWNRVGGYPEIALTAEDSLFNYRLRDSGAKFVVAEKAVVYYRPRGTYKSLLRQFYRYAKGDAICSLYPAMYSKLITKWMILCLPLGWFFMTGAVLPIALFLSMFLGYYIYLSITKLHRRPLLTSFLKISVDPPRIAGYAVGTIKRWRNRKW
jgi:glycosyltransferase involved in cell wall biosynthesis